MIQVEIKGDIKYDDSLKDIKEAIKSHLIPIGREAMEYAKMNKEYNNITWDLVSAYGFGIMVFGELVHIEVPAERNPHVIQETEETIRKACTGLSTGIILANGKEYASYVESKGKEVMSGTAVWVRGRL